MNLGSHDAHWCLQMTRFGTSERTEYLRAEDDVEVEDGGGVDDDWAGIKQRKSVIDASFMEDDIVE